MSDRHNFAMRVASLVLCLILGAIAGHTYRIANAVEKCVELLGGTP